MVTTGLRWGIRRRGGTRKMEPKGARKGPGRPAGLGTSKPAGLARSEAQSASIFFSAKYSSTLACVLSKPPTISAYKYPEAAVKRGIAERFGREHPETRSIRVRHKRKATLKASSSLGAAASWRTPRDPSLAEDFVTMIDYTSPSFMG